VRDPNAAVASPPGETATPATATPAATTAPVTTEPPSSTSSGSGKGMRIGSYVAFGVGAVGLGLGTYFLIDSRSKRSDADAKSDQCEARGRCLADDPLAAEIDDLDDKARSALTLSIVGFAVGGAGIAAGTGLFLASSSDEGSQASFTIHPVIGLGAAGVAGTF